jgi:small-conductance mechanosensitive channel
LENERRGADAPANEQMAKISQAVETATAELRQSLQKERDRAEALAGELAKAKREIEAQVALTNKVGGEATQLKQLKEAAETSMAELRPSLQPERDGVEAPAAGREHPQQTTRARIAGERASNSQVAEVKQQAAAIEPPATAEAQGSAEATRLLARASSLIGQGNIGAARIVLERVVETGSPQASFMLAETYDPLVLSTWKTYGTQGDVTKARELYAKALAGGIQQAKDRSVALH